MLAPDGVTILFDDPAVSGALRAPLAAPWPDVLSTLVVEESRFAGALTVVQNGDRGRLESDPFARIFPARIVQLGSGLLGRTPPPDQTGSAALRRRRRAVAVGPFRRVRLTKDDAAVAKA